PYSNPSAKWRDKKQDIIEQQLAPNTKSGINPITSPRRYSLSAPVISIQTAFFIKICQLRTQQFQFLES
ncbi:MAG: hypothetical protein AAGC99_23095, partial [Pseudomonadota bacterium]